MDQIGGDFSMSTSGMSRKLICCVWITIFAAVWMMGASPMAMANDGHPVATLSGQVESSGTALPGYQVKLYAAYTSVLARVGSFSAAPPRIPSEPFRSATQS